jgi:hypothetical protein
MSGINIWSKWTTQVAFLFLLVVLGALASPHNATAISFTNIGSSATFQNDIGIDYSILTGNLITSANYSGGSTTTLTYVDRFTGVHTPVPNFTGKPQELKVATVRRPYRLRESSGGLRTRHHFYRLHAWCRHGRC